MRAAAQGHELLLRACRVRRRCAQALELGPQPLEFRLRRGRLLPRGRFGACRSSQSL
jgi:hypothetical protein